MCLTNLTFTMIATASARMVTVLGILLQFLSISVFASPQGASSGGLGSYSVGSLLVPLTSSQGIIGAPASPDWVQVLEGDPDARYGHSLMYDTQRSRVVLFGGSRGGDRLSDTWVWDGKRWSQMHPATSPSARFYAAMTFDQVRSRILLFGGSSASTSDRFLSDTWEWDGWSWMQRSPATSPGARYYHAVAYDSRRDRVVLFGGADGQSYLSDTWEWDGSNWLKLYPLTSPSPRVARSIAYDSARQRVVLFGGQADTGLLSDTWEWDGSNWMLQHPLTAPRARGGDAAATYDSQRNRFILFGGRNENGENMTDLWEWDGNTWRESISPSTPDPRYATPMAYDTTRNRAVVFSGLGVRVADTWEWSGSNWYKMSPVASPPARSAPGMTYDSSRSRVILFGGSGLDLPFSDTWEWNGTRWTECFSSTSPPAQINPALAFDSYRNRTVLFGGGTWEWDGADWKQKSSRTSPAGFNPGLAYDSIRRKTVLFGGLLTNGTYLSDTWEWDGTNWLQKFPSTSPPPRLAPALSFDSLRGCVVLFGGHYFDENQILGPSLDDTWEWDGTVWRNVVPSLSPPSREGHSLVYELGRRQSLLFGSMYLSDTWNWDGAGWRNMHPPHSPGTRGEFGMAYDSARQETVLFGGVTYSDFTSTRKLDDTWLYRETPREPSMNLQIDGPAIANVGSTVSLRAAASSTSGSWNHLWIVGSSPGPVNLTPSPDQAQVLFIPTVFGTYTFLLTASTSTTASASAVFSVIANGLPTVSLGPTLTATVGLPVSMVASASDEDGDSLTYSWFGSVEGGPPVLLSTTTSLATEFTPVTTATYQFAFTASDGRGGISTASVSVSVIPSKAVPVTISVDLFPGLNLIGIPLKSRNGSYTVSQLIEDSHSNFAAWLPAGTPTGATTFAVAFPSFSVQDEALHGNEGYLLGIPESGSRLSLRGVPWPPSTETRSLRAGLNIIAYPRGLPADATAAALAAQCSARFVVRTTSGPTRRHVFDVFLPGLTSDFRLETNHAYLISVPIGQTIQLSP